MNFRRCVTFDPSFGRCENLFALAMLMLVCLAPQIGNAQTTKKPEASAPIQYRRIFVPQDRLSDAVPKNDRYLSIGRPEFEQLMNLVRAGERGEILQPARLTSAVYRVRLDGDYLVDGKAEIEIEHQGSSPCVLPLDPCTMAIASPTWHDVTVPTPALLGTAGATGPLGIMVEKSGSLRFNWSLGGERNTPDTLMFDLGLPRTPTKQIELNLPVDQVLLTSRGILSKVGEPAAGRQFWKLELGGHDRVSLRVVSAAAANERRRLTLLRKSASYDFSLHGVQVSSDWTLDVHHEPLSSITLNLEPKLRLVMARLAGTDIPWTATTDGESGVTSVVLQLAEPIEGVGRVLQLKAVAPLETDAPWQLPRIQAEDMFWAEGKTRLLIPASLSLLQLSPIDCRQTLVEDVSTPQLGEIIELQHFSAQAAVEVLISRLAGRLKVEQGITIDASVSELKGRAVADFKMDQGERFSLTANIPGEWIIDSVESVPSGALQDWNTEPAGQNLRRLRVDLRNAVTPTSPLRLIVSGRWRRPVTDAPLLASDCRLVEFESNETPRRLVLVRPASSLQLQTSGDLAFSRQDPAQLDVAGASLFDGRWQGVLFEIDKAAPELSFRFQSERPRYSAEVLVDAVLADRTLTESYFFHCAPESSRVERLFVHFSEARDTDLRWTLDGESGPQLTARRLHPDKDEAPDQVVGGETWEIVLKRPLLTAFDLRATRTRNFDGEVSLSLAALPEAMAQTGQLNLASTGSSRIVLRENRLKRVPGGQVTPGHSPEDRGSFIFEPERDVYAPDSAAIKIAPAAKNARLASAWVWRRQLETYLSGTEGTAHVATFNLENLGRSSTTIQVPDDAKVQAVWLDEVPVPQSVVGSFAQRFAVELPAGRRFPVVVVYYITPNSTPWLIGNLNAPPPTIDLSVLASNWTVWMPPGYGVGSGRGAVAPAYSWSERLFGPFGKSLSTSSDSQPYAKSNELNDLLADWVFPAEAVAEGFLHALGEPLHSSLSSQAALEAAGDISTPVAWGPALKAAIAKTPLPTRGQTDTDNPLWAFQVDVASLNQAGIDATDIVPTSELDAPAQRGLISLQSAGLALIVQPSGLILTTAEFAALHSAQLAQLHSSSVFRPRTANWQLTKTASNATTSLLNLDQWIRRPELPERPWQFPTVSNDRAGWTACRYVGSSLEFPSVVILSKQRMSAYAWISFLLSTALVWWILPTRTTWYLITLGTAGVLALVVPPAYVPLTSSIMLGVLVSGCVLVLHQEVLPQANVSLASMPWTWRQKSLTAGLGLLWFLAYSGIDVPAWAQQPGAPAEENATTSPVPTDVPTESPVSASPEVDKNPASDSANNNQQVLANPPIGQKSEPPAAAAAEVFQVFIPVDAQHKQVRDQYIISDRLRTLLQSRATATAQLPPAWLLYDADYQLRLNQLGMPPRLSVVELKTTWKFRTFQRDVTIRLPLSSADVSVVPGSARLNARPANPTWDSLGKVLELHVAQPDDYELSMLLGPPPQANSDLRSGVDFSIPKLATSRMTLHLPSRISEVAVPSVQGAILRETNNGSAIVRCALGPTDRLSVGLPSGENSSSASARTEVEELHWLRVQPGSVELYLRLKIKVLEGRIGQVRLAADPRLRLLPMSDNSLVSQVRSEAGPVQTILLDLKQPVSDQVTIDARMLLAGSSGIGNLRLPYMQMLGAQIKQRLLAVTLDEGLAAGDSAGEALATIPVGDFSSAWGVSNVVPQLAFRLPAQDIMWSLPIRPRESKTSGSEQLTVGVGRQSTRIEYHAELDTQTGFNFQHQLKVPTTLVVDEVEVKSATGEPLLSHWSQATAGEVTLFLNKAVTGKHAVRLLGNLPTKFDAAWRSPQIQIQSASIPQGQFKIYRTADVLVEVNPGPKMLAKKTSLADFYDAQWGRMVASFTHENSDADALLSVSVNHPEISPASALVTRLTRQNDSWQVELDYRLRVHKGLVDVIRFDIPNTWIGPFDAEIGSDIEALLDAPQGLNQTPIVASETGSEFAPSNDAKLNAADVTASTEPDVKLEVLPAPVEGRSQLVITPRSAIGDTFRVRIRGPLQVVTGERVRVPEFTPRGVEQLDRYVLLPTVIGARRWNWDVRGLKVSAPPANLSAVAHSPAPTYEAYQVVSDRFEAISKVAGRAANVAAVKLADVVATVSADGQVTGVATFDLEPAGLTECLMELPTNFQPVQLRVAGLPALSEPTGNGRWRVPLGPQQLPQRLEVLYIGRVPVAPAIRELTLPAPVLWQGRQAIRVEQTLWTIYNPSTWGQGESPAGHAASELKQEFDRMQSIATLLESVETQTAAEHTLPQLELWYQSWATRLRKTYDRILRQNLTTTTADASIRRSATALNQTQESAATRLGVMETLVRLQSQQLSLVEGSELWPWSLGDELPATHASFAGSASSIDVTFPSATQSDLPWRLAIAFLLAVIVTGLVDLSRRGWLQRFTTRWLRLLALLAGLAWVLWLTPSFIGWAIILLCALTFLWPRARRSPHAALA